MGKFIWTDLSTYDLVAAKAFYQSCLGWQYTDDGGYAISMVGRKATAGLYTMPDFFQSINMPSFWMPYIQVTDIAQTVERATQHGAKIEIKPEPFANGGMIALIRDPAGAGFTVFEGDDMHGRDTSGTPGRMVWNELHISDINVVKPFYEGVFDWTITPTDQPGYYDITDVDGVTFSAIQQLSNAVKGDKEYWSIYFATADAAAAIAAIKKAGGRATLTAETENGNQYLCYDQQGAFFFLQESSGTSETAASKTPFKWRTILGLILVLCAVLLQLDWVWGILFLVWLIPDLLSGTTFFLEPLDKRHNPALYWSVMATWIGLSIYSLTTIF